MPDGDALMTAALEYRLTDHRDIREYGSISDAIIGATRLKGVIRCKIQDPKA